MPGPIPDEKVDEVRQAADIVAVIRDHVPLKRSGASYKGLCPFHREKTPSFMVHPERQMFKCFGCGEAGDVFSFVMKRERMEFPEAVRLLARRFGVSIPESSASGESRSRKTGLYRVNHWAAQVFEKILAASKLAESARGYLKKRGIRQEMIERFGLGFAPPGQRSLLEMAKGKGIDEGLLVRAGLAYAGEGGLPPRDRFRNRIMFPIRDAQGRAVGFGARTLGADEPKYLNSPETTLFQKGRCLYALDLARETLQQTRRAVVTEGYTDVIIAHQFGVTGVVAVLGTALTPHHVRQLRRYVDETTLVFDADSAGQGSADRSVEAFVAEELPVRVMTLPAGKDPCDFLLEEGPERFEAALEGAPDWLDFKLARAAAQAPGGRLDASVLSARGLDGTLVCIGLIPNPVARDLLTGRVAKATGVSPAALTQRMLSLSQRSRARADDREEKPAARRDAACELMHVMLADNRLIGRVQEALDLEMIQNAPARELMARLFDLADGSERVDVGLLLRRTHEPDCRQLLEGMLALGDPRGDTEDLCNELIDRVRRADLARWLPEARQELAEKSELGDEEAEIETLRRIQDAVRARPPQTRPCDLSCGETGAC